MSSDETITADELLDGIDLDALTSDETAEMARALRAWAALDAPTKRDRAVAEALRAAADVLDARWAV